jgi:hypothetical protein
MAELYLRFSPTRATCPPNRILLHLIILITFSEEYKLYRSSSCSLLQPPVTLSLLGPNILLSTVLKHPQSMFKPIQNYILDL